MDNNVAATLELPITGCFQVEVTREIGEIHRKKMFTLIVMCAFAD